MNLNNYVYSITCRKKNKNKIKKKNDRCSLLNIKRFYKTKKKERKKRKE